MTETTSDALQKMSLQRIQPKNKITEKELVDRGVILKSNDSFYSFMRRNAAASQNMAVKTKENNEDLSTVDCRYLLLGQACADDCKYNHNNFFVYTWYQLIKNLNYVRRM